MSMLKEEKIVMNHEGLLEFIVGRSHLGLSIINVKEIIQPVDITYIPHAHPYIEGIIQLRGEVLPVINMREVLQHKELTRDDSKFIVGEFNEQKVVLHVDDVVQIHRVNQDHIESPTKLYEGDVLPLSGIIKMDERMILLVNFHEFIQDIVA
jgi:two-component system chemotaxis response regulator CheV